MSQHSPAGPIEKPEPNQDPVTCSTATTTVDWSVPTWVRHARLEAMLGTRLPDITWQHMLDVEDRQLAEDLSLDFKRTLYVLDRGIARDVLGDPDPEEVKAKIEKDRHELAKDVTAFANAAGGLLILGMADRDGKASRIMPVPLRDSQRLTLLDEIRSWTAPFVPGIEVGYLPSPDRPDHGCVLIFVPPSASGPHAVAKPNTHGYYWYMRDGAHARPLSEPQVAMAYRDRYAGRADVERKVRHAFDDGLADLDQQDKVWLAVSVCPAQPGVRRTLDRQLLEEFKAQAERRQGHLPGAPLGHVAAFGRGRVVLRDASSTVGRASDHLVHLYSDGCAFAGVALRMVENTESLIRNRPDLSSSAKGIRVESLTTWALTLLGITAGHAVDSGGSGDLEVICGLVGATETQQDMSSSAEPSPLQHVLVDQELRSFEPERIIPHTAVLERFTPVELTVPQAVAGDPRELTAAAAQIVSEVAAEFGQLPSDPLLTAEGRFIAENCRSRSLEPLLWWAENNGLLTTNR